MEQAIRSDAFRAAALRSERYRIIGLLITCGFFILVNFSNALVQPDAAHWWRTSNGVRIVLNETIAYVYARLVFNPE